MYKSVYGRIGVRAAELAAPRTAAPESARAETATFAAGYRKDRRGLRGQRPHPPKSQSRSCRFRAGRALHRARPAWSVVSRVSGQSGSAHDRVSCSSSPWRHVWCYGARYGARYVARHCRDLQHSTSRGPNHLTVTLIRRGNRRSTCARWGAKRGARWGANTPPWTPPQSCSGQGALWEGPPMSIHTGSEDAKQSARRTGPGVRHSQPSPDLRPSAASPCHRVGGCRSIRIEQSEVAHPRSPKSTAVA